MTDIPLFEAIHTQRAIRLHLSCLTHTPLLHWPGYLRRYL